jgi:methyl-accepting chemotaxis protein
VHRTKAKSPERDICSFSVRTRIVVLALIPVGGFLTNGFTYTAGESEVGSAFRTVTHATAVSDASRDFKSAVSSMRLVVKDFSASPDDTLIARFEQAHVLALKGLDALAESIDHVHAETIASLQGFPGIARKFHRLDSGAENTRL